MTVAETLIPAPTPADSGAAVEACAPVDPRAERETRHLAMLREMQEAGMAIQDLLLASARGEARRQAQAEQYGEEPPRSRLESISRAHAGAVRSLHQIMDLEIRIDDARIERQNGIQAGIARERQQARDNDFSQVRAYIGKIEVQDVVEQAIAHHVAETDVNDADLVDDLINGLYGQLSDPAREQDYGARCTGFLVARACRELGIDPDWDRWKDQDWAVEEAEQRSEGSPYAPPPRVITDDQGRYRFSAMQTAPRETGPP